ncbi:uncharacterized protein LOC105388007 [Plutella xylostella]|uniref:uncharacterized protein LOC105388007 n=1 Tax=Plutella xylostella TaxID=51655 RepID=UPI002032DB13|nr:uncharacterized protein LOC105388007 [Plutella xylostella]
MPWKRPMDVTPRVWRRFKGTARDGAPAPNYQIRDVDEKEKERCLDFLQEIFLRDEPLCQALDIAADPVSVNTIMSNWRHLIDESISLACYTEDSHGCPDQLAAVDLCAVLSLHDDDQDMGDQVRVHPLSTLNNVSTVFCMRTLCIISREDLAKGLGLEAMAITATAYSSQALCKKCGYEELVDMQYSDMLEQGIDLSNCSTPSAKVFGVYLGSS